MCVLQVAAVNGAEGQGQGDVLPIADSWGDSDEDLYESSGEFSRCTAKPCTWDREKLVFERTWFMYES